MNWRIILFLPLMWACTGQEQTEKSNEGADKSAEEKVADPAHNSKNSLDWVGTYKGMLPCEDCEGIETQITLKSDGKYSREEVYVGKSKTPLMGAGVYEWNEAGSEVRLKSPSGNHKTFKVVENGLIFYENGKSADSEEFRLEKNPSDPALENPKWVLVEIDGKDVSAFDFNEEPYLEFNPVEARISGHASCNNFFGRYELLSGKGISMGEKMGLTRKFCEGNDLEDIFLEALKTAEQYEVSDETLILKGGGKILAKLKSAGAEA